MLCYNNKYSNVKLPGERYDYIFEGECSVKPLEEEVVKKYMDMLKKRYTPKIGEYLLEYYLQHECPRDNTHNDIIVIDNRSTLPRSQDESREESFIEDIKDILGFFIKCYIKNKLKHESNPSLGVNTINIDIPIECTTSTEKLERLVENPPAYVTCSVNVDKIRINIEEQFLEKCLQAECTTPVMAKSVRECLGLTEDPKKTYYLHTLKAVKDVEELKNNIINELKYYINIDKIFDEVSKRFALAEFNIVLDSEGKQQKKTVLLYTEDYRLRSDPYRVNMPDVICLKVGNEGLQVNVNASLTIELKTRNGELIGSGKLEKNFNFSIPMLNHIIAMEAKTESQEQKHEERRFAEALSQIDDLLVRLFELADIKMINYWYHSFILEDKSIEYEGYKDPSKKEKIGKIQAGFGGKAFVLYFPVTLKDGKIDTVNAKLYEIKSITVITKEKEKYPSPKQR